MPVTLRPQPGPQEVFLSTPADIALYGGAAGGGKSWSLLYDPMRSFHIPDFTAMLFRRTSPMIRTPGGLWDESEKLYPLIKGKSRESFLEWNFPSGAVLKMSHLEYDSDVHAHQGGAYAYIGFDELTHFSQKQFIYMLSRNRSNSGVRPYMRATTNPDADSWVAKFIEWWIDQETGFPIPERSGVIRWFIAYEDNLYWADKPDDFLEMFPFAPPGSILPKSFTFIPARLEDNQILMRNNPGYKASLFAQGTVERQRLYDGNWKVKPASGKFFNRDWYLIIDGVLLPRGGTIVRFWDLAATEKQLKGPEPDWTAGVKMLFVGGKYYVLDCIAVQRGPTEVDSLILQTAMADRQEALAWGARYQVRWEKQPNAAGIAYNLQMTKMLRGFDCAGVTPVGDKYMRARAFASQSVIGDVLLLRGAWNEGWLQHMHGQPDIAKKDIMDATSGAFNAIASPEGHANAGVLLAGRTRGWT